MAKRLKIFFAAGPGDVIGTFCHWKQGRDDPSQISMTYSGQFFDLCREIDAEALVVASPLLEPKRLIDGTFRLEHRPTPGQNTSGIRFHLGRLWYELGLVVSALRFRADVAVVVGRTHWYLFSILPPLGIRVIPSLHSVLRRARTSRVQRWILALSRRLFARSASAILCASSDITRQIEQLTGPRHAPIFEFLPSYRRTAFGSPSPPGAGRAPFRVLFAGRVEAGKGVFDLLEVANRLVSPGEEKFVFDVCGTGGALEALRRISQERGMGGWFLCHGHCNRQKMREMYDRAHVVIAPTRTELGEGFNQVVAEAILAGRPVVTSSVCPALDYVRAAVVEVAPDDANGYCEALVMLRNNKTFYDGKVRACLRLSEQFYELERGWGRQLWHALGHALEMSGGKTEDGRELGR